jgi:hypothetical protein
MGIATETLKLAITMNRPIALLAASTVGVITAILATFGVSLMELSASELFIALAALATVGSVCLDLRPSASAQVPVAQARPERRPAARRANVPMPSFSAQLTA